MTDVNTAAELSIQEIKMLTSLKCKFLKNCLFS